MSGDPTILFVVDVHRGHVHATLGLAAYLRARGARIVYVGPPAAAEIVREQRCDFRAVPSFAYGDRAPTGGSGLAAKVRHRRTAPRRIAELTVAARCEVAALVAEMRPDLAVVDPFLLVFHPLLWAEGVPVVALSTKPLLRSDRATPPYTSRLVPRATPLGRARVRLAWQVQWARYYGCRARTSLEALLTGWTVRRMMRALATAVEFPWLTEWVTRPVTFDVCFRHVPEFALASRAFELTARPAPPDAVYAGLCVDLDRVEDALDWSWLSPGDRLVYCSLGTVARQFDRTAVRLLRSVVGAFAGRSGWAVLAAVADPELADSLDAAAHNVRVVSWAPQLASLRRAAVAVTHGGHNSVKECLRLGVPMVVYPRTADQFGNSARVVFHGVGRRGRAACANAPGVRRLVESVANDAHIRANVAAFQRPATEETDVAVAELLRIARAGNRST